MNFAIDCSVGMAGASVGMDVVLVGRRLAAGITCRRVSSA
jgi:hypothetical protein